MATECGVDRCVLMICLSIPANVLHLIMGAVSLWTRPPALFPSAQHHDDELPHVGTPTGMSTALSRPSGKRRFSQQWRRRHWASTSEWTEARKMQQKAAKTHRHKPSMGSSGIDRSVRELNVDDPHLRQAVEPQPQVVVVVVRTWC